MLILLRKAITVLVIIAIILPMLFLVTIALGDVTTTSNADQWGLRVVKQAAFVISVFWFLDLVLLVLTLAIKELVSDEFSPSKNETGDDEFEEM